MREDELYISYIKENKALNIKELPKDLHFKWINPKTGVILSEGVTHEEDQHLSPPETLPVVFIADNRK